MPRVFVNAVANFSIHGGIVSFTLQDQAVKTEHGEPKPLPPEDVCKVVMREQDFMSMLGMLQNNLEQYQAHLSRQQGGFDAGRKTQGGARLGAPAAQGGPSMPMSGPMVSPDRSPPGPAGGGIKIRPKR